MSTSEKPIRITQIMLSRGFGGAERAFVDTAMALADRGHTVQIICHPAFSRRQALEAQQGIEVVCVSPVNQYDGFARLRMRSALRNFNPDVAHIHLNRAAKLGGWAAASAGIPWVGTFHNYYSASNYANASRVFAISADVRQHAIGQGLAEEQVTVVPNFSRVAPAEQVRSRAGGPVRILSYGRFVHKKGFDVLLKAFRGLLDSGAEAELFLGGDGPDAGLLTALCKGLELEDHVVFGGWMDDVRQELDQADLFVLPSRDEPFGIVMLEAMARGVPVVTTRSQGPVQVLSDETAFFAEIGSVDTLAKALKTAVRGPEEASARAAKALDLYRTTYHEDAVLPLMEDLYRQAALR